MKRHHAILGTALGVILALSAAPAAMAQKVRSAGHVHILFEYVYLGLPGGLGTINVDPLALNISTHADASAGFSLNYGGSTSTLGTPPFTLGYYNLDLTTSARTSSDWSSATLSGSGVRLFTMALTDNLLPQFNINYDLNSYGPYPPIYCHSIGTYCGSGYSRANLSLDVVETPTGSSVSTLVESISLSQSISSSDYHPTSTLSGHFGDHLPKIDGTYSVYLNNLDMFSYADVPEPATWSMMLLGLAGAGGLLRRQRRRSTALGTLAAKAGAV